MARRILDEHLGFRADFIEQQLAHDKEAETGMLSGGHLQQGNRPKELFDSQLLVARECCHQSLQFQPCQFRPLSIHISHEPHNA
jgi:hypothetical protein